MISELVGWFIDKSATEMKSKLKYFKSFAFWVILLLLLSNKGALVADYALSCLEEKQKQLVRIIFEVSGSCFVWLIVVSIFIWIIAVIVRKIAEVFSSADNKINYLIRLRIGSEYKMLDAAEDVLLLVLVYAGLFKEDLLAQIGINDIGIILIWFLMLLEVLSSTIFGILNRFFVIWDDKK